MKGFIARITFFFLVQVDKSQLKRCYVSMYNASQGFLEGFSMQKARSAGPVPILFTAFAFNEGTGAAEGYMEFQDTIWSSNLIDRFEEIGATSVDVMTFQHNDGNQSAASAFNRVRKVAVNPSRQVPSAA